MALTGFIRWHRAIRSLVAALFVVFPFAPALSQESAVPKAVVLPGFVTLPVEAGDGLRFQRMDPTRGLSQTRVAQIVQDDEGYVWFGTQHGLNRFDGRDYRVFKHEPGESSTLGGVFIYALFKDRTGTIWVGSDQSLDTFDRRTETFRHFHLDENNPVVIHITDDSDGIVWLSTAQGLYRLDPRTGETQRFQHTDGQADSLASNDVKSTGFDREGQFWVVTGEGLDRFDRATGRVTLRIPLKEAVREFSFLEDRHGIFWIAYGSGNGLASYDRKTNIVTRYAIGATPAEGGLTGVYSIIETRDGTLWLGTMGGGLLKYDRQRKVFRSYRNVPGDLESLPENRVIALLEDNHSNIWVGLHATPPAFFPVTDPPFKPLRVPPSHSGADGESLVNAVFTDHAGTMWIGAGGALNRVDAKTGKSDVVQPPGGGQIEVLSIAEHPVGTLWVGSLGRGLLRLDLMTMQFTPYRHDPAQADSIGSDIVTRIFVDRSGTMWLATWNGLNQFDPATGRALRYKRNAENEAEGYFSIAQEADNALWLGSTTGLYRFDLARHVFQGFTNSDSTAGSISNDTVNAVLIDHSGTLWVGTQNGLNRYDRVSGRFRTFTVEDGLPGDVVSCILQDATGSFWMSTNNGIARLDARTGRFVSFSESDGLPGRDLTGWNACHASAKGHMLFGGFSGAVGFNPTDVEVAEEPPRLALTSLEQSDRPGENLQRQGETNENSPSILNLPAGRGTSLSIGFAAISFRDPASVRYRYRLTGLEEAWHQVSSDQRSVSYTMLPPGDYRFEVQARTGRSDWSATATSMPIQVPPPWQETWWARTAALGALLLTAGTWYRLRVNQLHRQYEIRLEERLAERGRIARELHDSLLQGVQGLAFTLQGIRNLLPGRPDAAAVLLDKALEDADFAVSGGREAVGELRNQSRGPADLKDIIDRVAHDTRSEFEAPPDLRIAVTGKPRKVSALVADEVFQIAREAMRNALRHANAGAIDVKIDYSRSGIALRIGDDGVGIAHDVLARGEKSGHWGLTGMRERATRIGGVVEIRRRPSAGTELSLSIPATSAYVGRDAHG